MSDTQRGPEQVYVAWQVVPYLRGCNSRRKTMSDIYTNRDEAILEAKRIDGDDNWMISGMTQEQYDRLRRAAQEPK